ncbi:hypothetical protein [Pectobacterium carotovorum]|uniref:hypothetical protein n=1 Tax=Pectobacterium carotovorum TaxID=554 RepID=UPI002089308D|nr:hypothetical protein [Pectobacterium carotovorum]GKV89338.1 hypothetical protein PEC301619_13200 [Pectobacterium carotovorum subsp. carotovorum]
MNIGSYCIHHSKVSGQRGVRVIAYDGDVVVVKFLGSGYRGVPEKSLTVSTKEEAQRLSINRHKGIVKS